MTNKSNDRSGMFEAVQVDPIQVTLEECDGNSEKMFKKFTKRVRKAEILKLYYSKLMYHETKSQKRRRKQREARFNNSLKKDE